MDSESLIPLLSELTKRLSPAPADSPPNELIIKGEDGSPDFIGRTLYKTNEIGIMQVFLPKGNVLPKHRHSVKEWIICFHGKIEMRTPDSVQIMGPGDCRYFEEGAPHESLALEDSKTIVITIPSEMEFPDA